MGAVVAVLKFQATLRKDLQQRTDQFVFVGISLGGPADGLLHAIDLHRDALLPNDFPFLRFDGQSFSFFNQTAQPFQVLAHGDGDKVFHVFVSDQNALAMQGEQPFAIHTLVSLSAWHGRGRCGLWCVA